MVLLLQLFGKEGNGKMGSCSFLIAEVGPSILDQNSVMLLPNGVTRPIPVTKILDMLQVFTSWQGD